MCEFDVSWQQECDETAHLHCFYENRRRASGVAWRPFSFVCVQRLSPGRNDGRSITESEELGGRASPLALISLVVGGVGIMNIMLVSVTERTREIGLRMAVGAAPPMILRQFLIEAVVLCLSGGAIGVVIGRLCSIFVWFVLRWSTEISVSVIVAAVGVSTTVGLIFGFYPAWKASRLDTIAALSYE